MADKWAQFEEAPNDKWAQYAESGKASDLQHQAPDVPADNAIVAEAKDIGKGALRGAFSTLTGLSEPIHNIPIVGKYLVPESGLNAVKDIRTPRNEGEKVGKTAEQVGEFLVPTGAEEKAGAFVAKNLPKAAKYVAPIAKAGTAALETGVRNKLQGGSFETGAEAGAVGSGVGQALSKVAPRVAESALKVTKRDRGYGKTIGEAALDEIGGVRPSSIAENASAKAKQLKQEIDTLAASHPTPISLQPAHDVIDAEIAKAVRQNNATAVNKLQAVKDQLTTDIATGNPIPINVPASQSLDLKRGIRNQFVTSWNPDLLPDITRDVAKRTTRAIDTSMDQGIGPEFANLNQRESSIIPVAKHAESIDREAGLGQRVVNRARVHTGALAGAGLGASLGYERGGSKGAIVGGLTGLIAPELAVSPTAQMTAARLMRNGVLTRPVVGSLLQLDRPDVENPRRKSADEE